MKSIFVIWVLISFISSALAQDSDITLLKRIEQTRINSFVTKDTAALNRLFADDLVFINTLGETIDKKTILLLIMQPERRYISAKIDSITNITFIENTAIVVAKSTLIRNLHNIVSTLHNSYMAVYEKRKKHWVLVALHITLLSAK